MSSNYVVLFFAFFVIWLWYRWLRLKNYWQERGIPYVRPMPIVGNLALLQKENPSQWMRQVYERMKSPIIGIWLFWRPGLLVTCPDIARQILVKDSDNFRNRMLSSGKSDPIGSLNIFTLDDPLWSLIRKQLSPLFTPAKLRGLYHIYESKSRDLVQRIKTDLEKGITINLRLLFSDYTTDLIGEAAFGVVCNATITGHSALRSVTDQFMNFDVWRAIAWTCIFFNPALVDLFRFSLFPKTAVQSIKKIFHAIVEQRGGYDRDKYDTKDMLDMLLKMKKEADLENNDISEDVLIAQAAIMLQGGYDTTAVTLTYLIYELAFDPERQEKLYQELAEAKKQSGEEHLGGETLNDLCYLNSVIKDLLYPSMGWLDRIALKDYEVNGQLTIPAGTPVCVNVLAMQRSAEYFPEPNAFRPERFLPENAADIKPFTYLPFGEGPRICIGQRFAYYAIRKGLASVILNYQVLPLPMSRTPQEIPVSKKSIFMCPDRPLSVQFVPRF